MQSATGLRLNARHAGELVLAQPGELATAPLAGARRKRGAIDGRAASLGCRLKGILAPSACVEAAALYLTD
jgi:hypothetical protein